jgi:methyl-accepting chemotaxis protein
VATIASASDDVAGRTRQLSEAMQAIQSVVDANGSALQRMVARVAGSSAAMGNIAASSVEQSSVTEEIAASTEEMAAQAESMSSQAQSLRVTADGLRLLVARFRISMANQPASELRRAA